MKTKSKLYFNTDSEFELPLYVRPDHSVQTINASDIPMLTWPDGSWCLLGNIYMLELFERGLSRRNRGGTLLTYATNISLLLRYAFYNKINLLDLTDNQFTQFIKFLQAETKSDDPSSRARNANSVITIGRNCLDFLYTISRLLQDENFIGPNGQVRGEQKEYEIKQKGYKSRGHKLARKYWHHRSFPTPDPKKTRLPISSKNVEKIRAIIQPINPKSKFLQVRRYVMLKLLELTGGRRSEVAALTCESVRNASKMVEPELKLITVKQRGGVNSTRLIPIDRHFVTYLMDFMEHNRKKVIRKTCGVTKDDGYFLVSERSGKGLKPNTITQELSLLSKAADIKESSCPHRFRHKFITDSFVSLIRLHNLDNPKDIRNSLLDLETLKQKVRQLTGHKNLDSLDPYIHLAIEEVSHFKNTSDLLSASRASASFISTCEQSLYELNNKDGDPKEVIDRLTKYAKIYLDELKKYHSDSNLK